MLILHNARIYTQDPIQPLVQAIAIRDQRILAMGESTDILALAGRRTTIQDMNGQTILPGLTDAHIHLQHYALSLQLIDCETTTRVECLRRVQERSASTPAGQWVLGHGWNQNLWPEGFGCADDLDAIAPHNPVYLTAKSLHASWANTTALLAAGITAQTPDPQGGKIGRLPDGKPNGILYESAMDLMSNILPKPGQLSVRQAIQAAQPRLWQMGITGCHDFDRALCFSTLQEMQQAGELHLRVLKSLPVEDLPAALSIGLRAGFGNDTLRIGNIKIFADGALGPQTAAMLEPYENSKEAGLAFLDSEQIVEIGQLAAQGGFALAIHAIGDRANHEVLNAYEQLRAYESQQNLPHLRHRIEHVQVLHPTDLPRLATLHIIASMQPIHATSDMLIADRYWGERAALSYAWQSLLEQGTLLAFGSDSPVESPNPFLGLHAALTRRPATNPTQPGWRTAQAISLHAALAAYTTGPAYAAGMQNHLGRLSPGFLADLIVLPKNPFTLPSNDLPHLQPAAVLFGGQWVWQA